jgi:plastocyanin
MQSRYGRKGTVLVAAILAATAVAGGALAAIAAHGSTASAVQIINVTETDYAIGLSQYTATPGYVKFVVTNQGAVAHKFGLTYGGVYHHVAGVIEPGTTKSLKVLLPKGKFTVFCKIHVASGMKALLTVAKPGGTTSTTTTTTNPTTTGGGGWG